MSNLLNDGFLASSPLARSLASSMSIPHGANSDAKRRRKERRMHRNGKRERPLVVMSLPYLFPVNGVIVCCVRGGASRVGGRGPASRLVPRGTTSFLSAPMMNNGSGTRG